MKQNHIRSFRSAFDGGEHASWPDDEQLLADGLLVNGSEREFDDEDGAEFDQFISDLTSCAPPPDAGFEELQHFRELLLQAARALSLRSRFLARLRSYALTDDLTGLYNRRGLLLFGLQRLKLSIRSGGPLLLFFMDIDNFKQINDSLGHIEGDAFLICCAEVLKRTFRDSDIVARLGGDEFAVLAQEHAEGSADAILRRLDSALCALNRGALPPHILSLSVGVARFDPLNPMSLGELISLADRQMYERKRSRDASSCALAPPAANNGHSS